jgi:DNA-binding transcriptional ArsR family regulator
VPTDLNVTFAALADPTRRAILARLAMGEATVTKLAEPFAMSGPAISKHLRVLQRAGLIARGRQAQWRPSRLTADPLKDAANWLEHYRRFWEESFDRLEDYLRDSQHIGEGHRLPEQVEEEAEAEKCGQNQVSASRVKNPKDQKHDRKK